MSLKTDIDGAKAAAQKVVQVHQRLSEFIARGQTLAQIDAFVAETLKDLGCKSCFLGYRVPRLPPFPSHACLSLNDCIVHGTAGYETKPLAEGDLLKVDIGVSYRGWIGDAAWSYSIGEPSAEIRKLMDCGKESLRRGIEQLRAGVTTEHWARTIEGYVEGECGFALVEGLGGHGYGRKLHDAPFVSNSVIPGTRWPRLEPGMLLAVEPMIAIGTGRTRSAKHEWPIFTADGSFAVHHEHDVAVTEDGPVLLTAGLDDVDDVIRR